MCVVSMYIGLDDDGRVLCLCPIQGATGSRLLTGNSTLYETIENEINEELGHEYAALASTSVVGSLQ